MKYICIEDDRNIKKGNIVEIYPPINQSALCMISVDNTIRLFIQEKEIKLYYLPIEEYRNDVINSLL